MDQIIEKIAQKREKRISDNKTQEVMENIGVNSSIANTVSQNAIQLNKKQFFLGYNEVSGCDQGYYIVLYSGINRTCL